MKSNYQYKFYGDLNSYIRRQYIDGLFLVILFIFLPLSFIYGWIAFIVSLVLIISALVFILNKFNHENNLILFTETEIILLKKETITAFKYEDINKIEYISHPKGNCFNKISFDKQIFKFNISTKVNTVFPYNSFYELVLNKNKNVEIIENSYFEKHKYFLHHGEVRKVQID